MSHGKNSQKSQRDYSKAIVIAKRKRWRKFCENVESAAKTSRLSRILSEDGSSHLDCLKLPNEEYTKSVEESLRHLMSTHFPGFMKDTLCSFRRGKTKSELVTNPENGPWQKK